MADGELLKAPSGAGAFRRFQMSKTIAATIAFLFAASAPLWAQKGGGGVGGGAGGGVGGGVRGGAGNPGGNLPRGVPDLPNDKDYSREGCAWVEPYSTAESAAQSSDKFLLVYCYPENPNPNALLASDFYLLDVIQLSKTTWAFNKIPYTKDNADLRKLGIKKPGTVVGMDKYGNEWKRLEAVSSVDLKALLASVPQLVKKFSEKLQADTARASALVASDEAKAMKAYAEIARLPRRGYKEIEDAAAKVEELAARQFKAVDLAFSVDEKQGIALLKQMALDCKDLPAGIEAEVRLAELDLKNGAIQSAIQAVKKALRMDGWENCAAANAHAKEVLAKIVAVGQERIEFAKKTGSADRPKAIAALRAIATEFAGTEAAKRASEAAKLFE